MEDVPENANSGCVGPQSEQAGKASACDGCPNKKACASGEARQPDPAVAVVGERLKDVKHKIFVLSGKGGVGKSTFSAQLAFSLASRGLHVGLLDVDICGPSLPLMLGLRGQQVHQSGTGWSPVYVTANDDDDDEFELGVMSIGFMLPNEDDAVIWRGPRKTGLIKQFLTDVDWGELDFLVIDTPPGTSDEHMSIVQYMAPCMDMKADGAVVVTTPQEVAMMDVRKELNFCKKTNIPVIGVVENMSVLKTEIGGLTWVDANGQDMTQVVLQTLQQKCPELLSMQALCHVFPPAAGGAEKMAQDFNVPFLGRLPLDPNLTKACEKGVSFKSAELEQLVQKVLHSLNIADQ